MQILGMKRRERRKQEDPRTLHHQWETGGEEGQRSWDRREMGEVLETTGDARSKITFTMGTVQNNIKEAVYVDTARRAFWSVKSPDTFNSCNVMYSLSRNATSSARVQI
jgi:hypothetical protein